MESREIVSPGKRFHLYLKLGSGTERSQRSLGLWRGHRGFDNDGLIDYDNDGWKDVMMINGHVYPQVDEHAWGTTTYAERPLLFHNNRHGKFDYVPPVKGSGLAVVVPGRGANNASLYLSRGVLHVQLGEFDKAETDFTKAEELHASQNLGAYAGDLAFLEANNPAKALEQVRAQLSAHPDTPVWVDRFSLEMILRLWRVFSIRRLVSSRLLPRVSLAAEQKQLANSYRTPSSSATDFAESLLTGRITTWN